MRALGLAVIVSLFILTPSPVEPAMANGSELETHHHLEILPAAARLSADGRTWRIPVHAWVYTPQKSRVRKAALAAALKHKLGLEETPATADAFDRRANLLFADNHRGLQLKVAIAGRTFALPPTRPNGHTRAEVAVPAALVQSYAGDGRLPIEAIVPAGDGRRFSAVAHLIPPEGTSVISDIDDTVKISHVRDRVRLMESTFFKPFTAVPGMAALFAGWGRQGIAFHFVSSSPWHLYAPLREMMQQAGLPEATFALKHIRLKDRTILDLFKDASETKPQAIEALLAAYPRRRFVLIGDSGELDPEIYARIYRQHPGRIVQILIRNVTESRADDQRFSAAFAGIAQDDWQLFEDPAQIRWRPD